MKTFISVDRLRAARPATRVIVEVDGERLEAAPLSASALARYLAHRQRGSRLARVVTLRRFLRAAFPFRWCYLLPGTDPVTRVLRLTPEQRGQVVAALLANAAELTQPGAAVPYGLLLENITNG